MILDTLTLMSDDQSVAVAPGNVFSDVLDLQSDGYTASADAPSGVAKDIGKGNPVEFLCQVTTAGASAGAATIQAVLETSADEAFTTPVTVMSGPVVAVADAVQGKHLLPEHIAYGALNYLRVKYVIGAFAMTGGAVTAGIVAGHQSN